MSEIVVYKNRTNVLPISLGIDVSTDVITSQIRTQPEVTSPLIVEWDVDFLTDGTDGELVLTIDQTAAAQIVASSGFMDLKRVSGSTVPPLFDRALEVVFRGAVTE